MGSHATTGQSVVEIRRLAVVMLSNSTQRLALHTRWQDAVAVSYTSRQMQLGGLTRVHVYVRGWVIVDVVS